MAISPWYVGQTLPVAALTFQDDSGSAINLTGATLSLVIRPAGGGTDITGAGTFSIENANTGSATYAWASSDVALPGNFQLIFKITYSNGSILCDPIPWTVVSV